ncbi:T-cell receptor-associated transmembrane adapter 1 isoform X1 [Thamnophis elegans]|uniref:T-cell receptor-associated transmembrane adapter 1 isoform X1 n=2 Tax=Thamnophis elegans TaxID=35005 RepID=UPI0013764B0A|nr:T-cell receptor-associated transmembrane adapter 1 isoform X1 [Thamnophis elegans]
MNKILIFVYICYLFTGMEANQCTICWIPLSFVTVIMIISLLKNVLYFLKNKKQKDKICEDYNEYHSSNEDCHEEVCPVYDNLNHYQQEMLNESCYEQMNVPSPRPTTDVQQSAEPQMCYASLDHSVRRKHKIQPKKKYRTLEMGENQLTRNNSTVSCIYLNSAQLSAEKLSENTSKVDSFREFGLKHNANDVIF